MGLWLGVVNVYKETSWRHTSYLGRHLSSPRAKGFHDEVLTFPVLLKVGFLMAGTLGAGRRGRRGATPAVGSGLEDPWSLKAGVFRASPGTPEAWNGVVKA